jgi:hypothetical protein
MIEGFEYGAFVFPVRLFFPIGFIFFMVNRVSALKHCESEQALIRTNSLAKLFFTMSCTPDFEYIIRMHKSSGAQRSNTALSSIE